MESEAEPNPPPGASPTPEAAPLVTGSPVGAPMPSPGPESPLAGPLAGADATATLLSAADPPPPPFSPEPAPALAPPVHKPPSILFLSIITTVSLAADLATKWWAKANLSGVRKPFVVIKDHFDFIFAQNPGGAWSFLRSLPDTLRRPFFLVVSAGAIVFIVSIYRRIHPDQRAMKWGLPLALGGAMGNLVDRIRYGWVVDFMDVYLRRGTKVHHWPTFNVADIVIVIGVGLMAIDMISSRGHKKHSDIKPEPVSAAPPAA